MRRLVLVCFFLGLLSVSCLAEFQVASKGHSACTIVVDPVASPAEKHAAQELADYLNQITGAQIPVLETAKRPAGRVILVGQGSLAKGRFASVAWGSLRGEQALFQGNDHTLLVAGGRPRGTLYAVYRLLNRVGVRWWTPWATDVPHDASLKIKTAPLLEEPTLEYRDPSFHSEFNPEWAAHNFCNEGPSIPELGGGVTYEGFVHTYYPLIPPEKYFKSHPEWFSLIDGKRTAQDAQLCTTNPELRKEILKTVLERLRKNPNATIVSVSQNDCFQPCQCDVCQALANEQGSQSAPGLALANYVADGIKSEFPNVAVDTLAYQWSRHAPSSLRPLPNVIVRLCSIECDFGSPLSGGKNSDFAKDVLDWSKLTRRLYVWDYVTNFQNYLQPMPDEAVLGPNLSFLASNGVKGVFEEGDYTSNGGAMSNLKAWVLAKLLWDPHADSKAITREFTAGYFGSAREPIDEYLELLSQEGARTACTIFQDTNAPYLTPQVLLKSETLWKEAEARVSSDPEKLWRVREAHLAIQFVFLKRWEELRKFAFQYNQVWPIEESKADFEKAWLAFATSPGPKGWEPVNAISEGGLTPKAFIDSLKN